MDGAVVGVSVQVNREFQSECLRKMKLIEIKWKLDRRDTKIGNNQRKIEESEN